MQLPLQISFRNLDPSQAVEARIRDKAAGLERFDRFISACRVVVEAPHRRRHKGRLYIRIDLTVPGEEPVIGRGPQRNHAHEDIYVAICNAFDAAVRQLEDYARRQCGDVKAHSVPAAKTLSRAGISG